MRFSSFVNWAFGKGFIRYSVRPKASSPTITCGTGLHLDGRGAGSRISRGFAVDTKDSLNLHLFHIPPSDIQPLAPTSTYKNL